MSFAAGDKVTAAGLNGTYLTYTPTWTSTGTPPAIGNGTIAGDYVVVNAITYFTIYMTGGSTTTPGTGTYTLTLPTTPKTTTGNHAVGSYTGIFDHSSAAPGILTGTVFSGQTSLGTPTGGIGYMAADVGSSGVVQWNATTPFVLGNNFQITIAGWYYSS